jgi:YD repeat-containing protein
VSAVLEEQSDMGVFRGGGDGLIDVKCEYAPNGQLAALIDDNGNRSEWTYDAHGRKIFEVKGLSDDPPGLADRVDGPSTMTWTFNADGALASMTKEDGATLSYDYDGAKRLTAVKKGSTTLQSFEYDGVGRQTESMDTNTTSTNSDDATATRYYDSLGRGVEETLKIGSGGTLRAVTTDYTGERRSSLVYPNGRRVDYSCHAGGALDTISDNGAGGDPIGEYDYIGGRTLRRKMRNGVNLDLRDGSGTRYDSAGLPTRWAHLDTNEQGSPVVIGFEYGYDCGGNKLYQRSLHDPLDSQRYAYDSAERLAAYSRGWFGSGFFSARRGHDPGQGDLRLPGGAPLTREHVDSPRGDRETPPRPPRSTKRAKARRAARQ